MEELAGLWLSEAASALDPELASAAVRELGPEAGEEQGLALRVGRSMLEAVSRVELFAHGGLGLLSKINRFNLWQVGAYMNDVSGSREQIFERFRGCVDTDTRVVVAHSLGSVVAYESIHRLGLELDLFMTLGSPLGVKNLFAERVVPVGVIPAGVVRWVNVADPDDPIAAKQQLRDIYRGGAVAVEDVRVHNVGRTAWHSVTAYLSHDEQVRQVLWEALDG